MAAAAKRGIRKRIKAGWWLGLKQFDKVIWIGTLSIIALLLAIPYAGWMRVTSSDAFADFSAEINRSMGNGSGPRADSPPPAVGSRGWTFGHVADLNPRPKYELKAKLLPAYTAVRVLDRTADGQWLKVEASLVNGRRFTGYVLAERVGSKDPAEGTVPESGWVKVAVDNVGSLRAAPDFDAETFTRLQRGQVLEVVGRKKRREFMPGVSGDFLLVRNPGNIGPPQVWVAQSHVESTSAP
ncbi:MAG: hypothetical protein KIT73_04590 [Burkholderiales bacterium]|nr:hypothetical protein [Burkholderiales bacterium]